MKQLLDRICPKCGTKNPPTEDFSHDHNGTKCKQIVNQWRLFGILPMNKYCGAINDCDESDDWIYLIDGERMKKLNNDFFSNGYVPEDYVVN